MQLHDPVTLYNSIIGTLHRAERLCQQKQQIVSDLENIKDEAEDLRNRTDYIDSRLDEATRNQRVLMKRVEQIIYRVESKSPFLSEAEECMKTELEGLQKHIKVMSQRLVEVYRQLQLHYCLCF